jgi:hypothetical protein
MNGVIKGEELNRSQNSSKFNLDECTNFVPRKIFLANNSLANSLANSTNSINLHESNGNFVQLFTEDRKEQRPNVGMESEEEFELFVSPSKRITSPPLKTLEMKHSLLKNNSGLDQPLEITVPDTQLLVRRESMGSANLNMPFTPTMPFKFNLFPVNSEPQLNRTRMVRKTEVPNYNLKRTLFVYFYHREGIEHYAKKYPISDKELTIMKIILKKKLIYDKKHFKKDFDSINQLTQDTYIKYLTSTPPIFRKNIIKSKLFKKIVKFLMKDDSVPESVTQSINLKEDFSQMTNTYYENCFKQTVFRDLFFATLDKDHVFKAIVTKCKRQFVKRVDEWIVTLENNLGTHESSSLGEIKHIRMATSREEIEEAKKLFQAYL